MSSEAKSTGGTVTSFTRNTIHSLLAAPAVCPTPSLAVRNAAAITPAGTPGREASRLNPLAGLALNPPLSGPAGNLPARASLLDLFGGLGLWFVLVLAVLPA